MEELNKEGLKKLIVDYLGSLDYSEVIEKVQVVPKFLEVYLLNNDVVCLNIGKLGDYRIQLGKLSYDKGLKSNIITVTCDVDIDDKFYKEFWETVTSILNEAKEKRAERQQAVLAEKNKVQTLEFNKYIEEFKNK